LPVAESGSSPANSSGSGVDSVAASEARVWLVLKQLENKLKISLISLLRALTSLSVSCRRIIYFLLYLTELVNYYNELHSLIIKILLTRREIDKKFYRLCALR
jgi:hypothetical protein